MTVVIITDRSNVDGGAGAGDARPWERGTRAKPKTISHLDPFSIHGWVPSVPALSSKRKRPSWPGHYSRLPACCRLRPHRVADGTAWHRRIRYGLVCVYHHWSLSAMSAVCSLLSPLLSFLARSSEHFQYARNDNALSEDTLTILTILSLRCSRPMSASILSAWCLLKYRFYVY